jgi:hypothetical protein
MEAGRLAHVGQARQCQVRLQRRPRNAAFEESLTIARELADTVKDNIDVQTDLVVSLYKLAKVSVGEQKEAAIGEGLKLLARLDADGKLTEDQKGWGDSFRSLRNGSQ